jgi:hypothetical protein
MNDAEDDVIQEPTEQSLWLSVAAVALAVGGLVVYALLLVAGR